MVSLTPYCDRFIAVKLASKECTSSTYEKVLKKHTLTLAPVSYNSSYLFNNKFQLWDYRTWSSQEKWHCQDFKSALKKVRCTIGWNCVKYEHVVNKWVPNISWFAILDVQLFYYIFELVHALWLVSLAGRTLLHGLPKFKVFCCLTVAWFISPNFLNLYSK